MADQNLEVSLTTDAPTAPPEPLRRSSIRTLAEFRLGDTLARYLINDADQNVGLMLIPFGAMGLEVERRQVYAGGPEYRNPNIAAFGLYGLLPLKRVGEAYAKGFSAGQTLQGAVHLRFRDQKVTEHSGVTTIETRLSGEGGLEATHNLSWRRGTGHLRCFSSVRNAGSEPLDLELLSSFCLEGITPFDAQEATGRLTLHRFRSSWSAEGRLESRSFEDLHLEPSWSGSATVVERFGQVGSMPVRKYHPTAAIEDTVAGVCWGAQLHWAGSWQMEVYRKGDTVSLSGGLADRDLGHWVKRLEPGESLQAPEAVLATCQGSVEALCERLVEAQDAACEGQPASEQDLALAFNDWCTSWGHPSHDSILALAWRLKGSPIKYLVMDAGWYEAEEGDFYNGHGDWQLRQDRFPHGLAALAKELRSMGFIPGIWFEFESVGRRSQAFKRGEHFLRLDGKPLTVGDRRFWDLRDPVAVDFLAQHVIKVLKDGGFGYLKVDYNESLGIGCDGAESLGEGARLQAKAMLGFFDRLRQELPELVIENCASGGHRLEPALLSRCAMGSFSDAHETREIPIIAAHWHRLILPRQSQVWVVLRKADDERRLIYSLAAGFLGRACLSGDITDLDERQWSLTRRALDFYGRVVPILKAGRSRLVGTQVGSWRQPTGWQALSRLSADGQQLLVVAHAFAQAPLKPLLALPPGRWALIESLGERGKIEGPEAEGLRLPLVGDFSACVLHLKRLA